MACLSFALDFALFGPAGPASAPLAYKKDPLLNNVGLTAWSPRQIRCHCLLSITRDSPIELDPTGLLLNPPAASVLTLEQTANVINPDLLRHDPLPIQQVLNRLP